jgi:uncharacterized protein (DUF934 family)
VRLGLRLRNTDPVEALRGNVARFDLIALEFPKFTDGRAYSHARLLRERYGYRGELRAVGSALRDQLAFMRRCGFDSYEIKDGVDADAWIKALGGISVVYQPATDGRASALALRHGIGRNSRADVEPSPYPSPASGRGDSIEQVAQPSPLSHKVGEG